MTTTKTDLIKVDCLGRVRTTPEHREALIRAFESSAMGGPEFCSHHGIKYQTFATWLQKHRRATGAYSSPTEPKQSPPLLALSLAEVEIPKSPEQANTKPPSIEIRLPGGALMHLDSTAQLPLITALLRELNSSLSC